MNALKHLLVPGLCFALGALPVTASAQLFDFGGSGSGSSGSGSSAGCEVGKRFEDNLERWQLKQKSRLVDDCILGQLFSGLNLPSLGGLPRMGDGGCAMFAEAAAGDLFNRSASMAESEVNNRVRKPIDNKINQIKKEARDALWDIVPGK